MSRTARIASFGSAGLLVICGTAGAIFLPGEAGEIVAMVLIGLGLILATALVFLEVGLSEDQERAREQVRRDRERTRRPPGPAGRRRPTLGRSTGHRRRLS